MKTARGALRKDIPGYAGGGFIDGLKRAVGMAPAETMREKIARQDAERASKQPAAPATAPAPTETGQTALASYAGGTLTGDRKKQMEDAIGKKAGGPITNIRPGGAIRGPGTGTSDDVPLMGSNGEFMIKASSVKKIGIEALEALNAIGDEPDEKDSPAEAKSEYGMKCGGAVRKKMATGGLVTDEERRKELLAQIPTGGTGDAPTPAASQPTPGDGQMSYGDQMRNLGGALLSAPAGALQTLVSAPGYGLNSPAATPAPAVQPATVVQPANALPSYSPAKDSQAANPQPATQPTEPTAPADGATPARLNGVDGKSVGYGATRFDVPGKSPLFTNMTDAAGMADNTKLQGRPVVSTANQGALDGIQARQDAGDRAALNKIQYDKEVAGAQAINEAGRRMNLEYDAKRGGAAGAVALKLLAQANDADVTKRGQDIQSQGQAVQAGALRASQKMAQDKFAQDSKGAAIDQQGKVQIQALQNALLAEQDPAKRQLIEDNLRAVQGKYEKAVPQKYTVYNLPDTVDANGQVVRGGQGALDAEGKPIDIRPQPKPVPKVGDVVSGHKFKGGNPADQKNWEKV